MVRWLALIFPLLFATAAAAQGPVTGSIRHDTGPISVPEGETVGDKARAITDRFALCIVQRHNAQVVKALAGDADEQYVSLPKLMDAECFSGSGSIGRAYGTGNVELTTNPVAFRGALYKALVQRKYGRHPAGAFAAKPVEMPADNGLFLRFADCLVRKEPATSLDLILATAGSPREQDGIGKLQPQFGQCLLQGINFQLPKAAFVAFLAEAYYREAEAANSTSAD